VAHILVPVNEGGTRTEDVMKAIYVAVPLAALAIGVLAWSNRAHAADKTREPEAGKFFCNLHGLDPAERKESSALRSRLLGAIRETHELEDGFALQVDEARMGVPALFRWVELERRCCPFFHFAIELQPNKGPTWLRLTGQPGVKAFVQHAMADDELVAGKGAPDAR
jgi:hypothetical protein